MSDLSAPAQAIQAALLADAEALIAAEGRGIGSPQMIRALAGAVARRLAALEEAVYEVHEGKINRLAENLGGLLEDRP